MAHLTLPQRQQIAEGIRSGKSNARIARELCVNPSTVGREIARNSESREHYAAGYAHTLAASRQILAARHRFICAAEVYVPTGYQPDLSPFASFALPALYYGRPVMTGCYPESFFRNTYYYKGNYPVRSRFDQVSGIFKSSGQSPLSRPRWSSESRHSVFSDKLSFKNTGQSTGIFKRGNDMVNSRNPFSLGGMNADSLLTIEYQEVIPSRKEAGILIQLIPSFFRPENFYVKKPLAARGKSLVHFLKAGKKIIFSKNSYLHPSRHA